MDRNDLQDNGLLDLYQNLTEYTFRLCPSYYVKIKLKFAVLFTGGRAGRQSGWQAGRQAGRLAVWK